MEVENRFLFFMVLVTLSAYLFALKAFRTPLFSKVHIKTNCEYNDHNYLGQSSSSSLEANARVLKFTKYGPGSIVANPSMYRFQ